MDEQLLQILSSQAIYMQCSACKISTFIISSTYSIQKFFIGIIGFILGPQLRNAIDVQL